jgi:hypothetical protein
MLQQTKNFTPQLSLYNLYKFKVNYMLNDFRKKKNI